ncbi:MAG: SpoIIE family protein phosphatase [Lachnospiraceae bacterium]|nr:SpoIIE family protein phosphatase [Lachnospiraceae bacterium]
MAFNKKDKISTSFRSLNILFFAIAMIFMISIMFIVLRSTSINVAKDYAELHSSRMLGVLNTYFSGEIALVRKAAHSNAVIDWFDDENNPEKKLSAYNEMMGVINELKGKNLYIGIEKTFSELSVDTNTAIEDLEPFATLKPDYYDDAWYFDCALSEKEYQLNVDIDKVLQRKLIWLNYKVVKNDIVYGVLCTGMEFSSVIAGLFAEYDDRNVRTLVIDENGYIQMDSAIEGYIHYSVDDRYLIADEFHDVMFLSAIDSHLNSIDGYFNMDSPTIVLEKESGQFQYATIAPINATTWSVITLYDSSMLFNMLAFLPLISAMLILFVIYIVATSVVSQRYVFKPFENLYEKMDQQNRTIMGSINYAQKIQKNLLPTESVFKAAFSDYSIIWKPRDVVGGDVYWAKNFAQGTLLCVCDCTGHGTPGALLTTLVVSAFEDYIDEHNCTDTAGIIWNLERRLVSVFSRESDEDNLMNKDGCDLAVLYIANDGNVHFSSAHTNIFVSDGKEVQQFKGQRIFVGQGLIKAAEDIKTIHIPANPNNKFYIASDGLTDQPGGESALPYGYKEIKTIILENHHEKQEVISARIWQAFEKWHDGEERVDDVELITFSK